MFLLFMLFELPNMQKELFHSGFSLHFFTPEMQNLMLVVKH